MGRYKIFIAVFFCFFSTFASALTREQQVTNSALTDHANTAMRAPTVSNGMVNTSVTQRVVVGGSAAEITTPFGFAADKAAVARSAASLAGKIAGGYAAVEAAKWAVQKLLDGVGYVMDPVAQSIKKPADLTSTNCADGSLCPYSQYIYYVSNGQIPNPSQYGLVVSSSNVVTNAMCQSTSNYVFSGFARSVVAGECVITKLGVSLNLFKNSNPYYSSNASLPPAQTQTQQQVQDAFLTWMQNNPTNVTDPIVQAMYTPAQTTGWNLTGSEGAHYGPDGLTDEMVNNILANRNAALSNPTISTIKDSVAPATPDSSSTTISPDGTQKTTQNRSYTNTDGVKTATSTTTTTKPDGTTSTETTTTTTQAAEAPAFCDYFSTLCGWLDWTKTTYQAVVTTVTDFLTPDNNDDSVDIDDPQQDDSSFSFSLSAACPAPIQLVNSSFMGVPINWQYDFADFCTILTDYVRPILIAMGSFIAVLILGGVRTTDD